MSIYLFMWGAWETSSTSAALSQVRHLQQCRKKHRPQEQNLRRVRRRSSRRSAYAFSHQEGYGQLITSGKNMKTSTVSSSCSPERTANSSNWIENVLKRKNEVACISWAGVQTINRRNYLKTWLNTVNDPILWIRQITNCVLHLKRSRLKSTQTFLSFYY